MKLAAMQPYFFPYIGYFQLLHAADKMILHDGLDYIRKGYMHRNRYLESGVGAMYFGPEIQSATRSGTIADVRLSDTGGWRVRTLARLRNAYARSPFFDAVFPLVTDVIEMETERLAELNAQSIRMVCEYLELSCELELTADSYQDVEAVLAAKNFTGYHDEGKPDLDRKHSRVLLLCQRNGAAEFINPIGGVGIYDREALFSHGLKIAFLKSDLPQYKQINAHEFVPGLSILDALFHCSPEQVRAQLYSYMMH